MDHVEETSTHELMHEWDMIEEKKAPSLLTPMEIEKNGHAKLRLKALESYL